MDAVDAIDITVAEAGDAAEKELKKVMSDATDELVALTQRLATNEPRYLPLVCRWGQHNFLALDPTDAEHAEVCELLGRNRASLHLGTAFREILDRICIRCGHIDPGLQRFLISLRKLRSVGKR